MRTNDEMRSANTRLLVERMGSDVFCKRMKIVKQQLSQYIGRKPTRKIGEKMARGIETEFNLPRGWLDHDHSIETSLLNQLVEVCAALPDGTQTERIGALIALALELRRGTRQTRRSEPRKQEPSKEENDDPPVSTGGGSSVDERVVDDDRQVVDF